METNTGMLEESPGVKSSKRTAGISLVVAGGLLLMATGAVGLFVKIADLEASLSAGNALIWAGAVLLGVTILEGLGKKIGGDK